MSGFSGLEVPPIHAGYSLPASLPVAMSRRNAAESPMEIASRYTRPREIPRCSSDLARWAMVGFTLVNASTLAPCVCFCRDMYTHYDHVYGVSTEKWLYTDIFFGIIRQ